MAHSLNRLIANIHNTPHLITPESLRFILERLYARHESGVRLDPVVFPGEDGDDDEEEDDDQPMIDQGIGWLCVEGSLTYKPVATICGEVGASYQSLQSQVQDMADAGVKTIVMEVASGGGEGSHCFETANEIREICDDNGITLIGYADEYACSAAYALICVCDTVIANPSATLGSIGCVISLWDKSEALKKEGYKPIFITSGENKVPYDENGAFKQSCLDELQEDVDRMNDEFTAHVNKYTGIPEATIRGWQAGVFDAQTAVQNGLAKAVMTGKQFATFVASFHKGTLLP